MKTLEAFPIDTATGACLILRKSDPAKVGRIVQLDVDLEGMPPFGVLCISEKGVEVLNAQLDLKVVPKGTRDEVKVKNAELESMRADNDQLRAALRDVFNAASFVGVDLPPEVVSLVGSDE